MDSVTPQVTHRPELLPPEAPLSMPVQPLGRGAPAAPAWPDVRMALRRVAVFGGTALLTAFAVSEMWLVLGLVRLTTLGVVLTALFGVLFVWIALAFFSALAGFFVMVGQRRHGVRGVHRLPHGRTALLMPIYHEPIPRLQATLRAMRASLDAAGATASFDIFVLSDSRAPDACAIEQSTAEHLSGLPGAPLFYRCRENNTHRKAGNIAEWVNRFGGAYDHFVILDADSLIEADTLLAMVARMEDDPRLGLLQTLPLLHGARTRFARLQQFAGQIYGPMLAHGLAWWSGHESNYWGHNAMIRTRAFAESAGLPELRGRKPFGGMIMSHDFVEAALLRRAGWRVMFDPGLGGSWEEGPPTLPDLCARDRRWCQGNIQHAAVIGARGLHPVNRLHMAQGIFAYISAPLWLAFLVMALLVGVQARFVLPEYFPDTPVLFPQWPVVDPERALSVFVWTMALLLAPKLLAALAFALSSQGPRSLGAGLRLLGGFLTEVLLSALLSPITMLTQIRQLVGILSGRDGGWEAQRRDAGANTWREGLRFSREHVVLGAALLATALAVAPLMAAWMAPVLVGLLLAPLLVGYTSGPEGPPSGRLLSGRLLETPSERAPPPILRLAQSRREVAPVQPMPAGDVLPAAFLRGENQ
jgi:membrane glycosyltransferase